MLDKLWEKRSVIVTAGLVLIALLLLVMPPEAKLGSKVRLVYFHASIAENAIIFFVLGGVAALLNLLKHDKNRFTRAVSFFSVAFYLWIFQTALGGINMKIIWGNFFWTEPKAFMGLILLFVSLVIYLLIETGISKENFTSFLLIFMALAAIFGLLFTSNVFHPKNAIFGSNVFVYKVIFVLIVIIWFVIVLIWSDSLFRSKTGIIEG